MSKDLITKITQEFDTITPLQPNDPRYVDCSVERGSTGLIREIANNVRRVEKSCWLFSGHRGCGKTTELFRLQRELESKTKARPFVVYCETDEYLKLDDVGFTDVLLAMVHQLWRHAQATDSTLPLKPGKWESLWAGVKDLTGKFHLKEAEAEIGFHEFLKTKLVFEIKDQADARRLLRSYFRDRSPTLLDATNEFIRHVGGHFKDKGYSGLVIMMDNLDRIVPDLTLDPSRGTYQTLFVEAADYLYHLDCNVIYTVPPSVVSFQGPALEHDHGIKTKMLPMIPIADRNDVANENGIARLIETIALRVFEADPLHNRSSVSLEEKIALLYQTGAFDSEETVKRLCVASGGHMRRLMMLMQSACNNSDDLPIRAETVSDVIRDARDGFISALRPIPNAWEEARKIANDKELVLSETTARLLETFAVLEFLDEDGPWHDVNPVIRQARQFKA
ncbi:MAG TPA: hypothetical protein PKD31_17800 [Blastocatellia bacterium]|nr:hypothetical protein [Blastocatellia bacterium]